MYRPSKRKFVRRVSAASVVAVVAAAGVAITLFNQAVVPHSVAATTASNSTTTPSSSTSATAPSANYRLVSAPHEDGASLEGTSNNSSDN